LLDSASPRTLRGRKEVRRARGSVAARMAAIAEAYAALIAEHARNYYRSAGFAF
jgi:hypothetical protein